jgi:hypothetical protein
VDGARSTQLKISKVEGNQVLEYSSPVLEVFRGGSEAVRGDEFPASQLYVAYLGIWVVSKGNRGSKFPTCQRKCSASHRVVKHLPSNYFSRQLENLRGRLHWGLHKVGATSYRAFR